MNTNTRAALQALEIAVRDADLRRVAYDGRWIYINRIGKKVRILTDRDPINNGGTIRSAIKITWNAEVYDRAQMARHVRALLPAIQHFATMGTCHPFRRLSEVGTLIAGGLDTRKPGLWYMTTAVDATNTTKVRALRASILGL